MKKVFVLLGLVLVSFSCIKDVDYNQIESSEFTTPLSIALLQLDLNQNDFLDANNNEITSLYKPYIVDLSGLYYESVTDNLTFSTQFSSTFDRDIYCQLTFFNGSSVQLMTSDVYLIQSNNSPVIYSTTYEGDDYDLFASVRRIDVKLFLRNGISIQPDDNTNFSMQSVIHFDMILQPQF